MVMDLKYLSAHRCIAVAHRAPHRTAVMKLKYPKHLQLRKLRVPPERESRSLVGILSAAVIHVTLHGRVSNGQIAILKVVMERVPAVARPGSKGTPGQAGRCPGTSGQAVALPMHQDYERQHPAKP